MKYISILGSTGSIGVQTLDTIARHTDRFEVVALCANSNADLLIEQARRFQPRLIGLSSGEIDIPSDLRRADWSFGVNALRDCATVGEATHVVVAVVGSVGLPATLAAINGSKQILLANKETLVTGGEIVMNAARSKGVDILPIDSEHSAIFRSMLGAKSKPARLILTASGGPFREWTAERMRNATLHEALNHPNWSMGRKITIDSASMINKALEVIEAHHLFHMEARDIDVVIHKESIIHSMVSFEDGAVIAQLGEPDMRVPIAFALSYPDIIDTGVATPDFARLGFLSFEEADKFDGLKLGYEALKAGGDASITLNAANEVAVQAFIDGAIRFGGIVDAVARALDELPVRPLRSLEDVMESDGRARRYVERALRERR